MRCSSLRGNSAITADINEKLAILLLETAVELDEELQRVRVRDVASRLHERFGLEVDSEFLVLELRDLSDNEECKAAHLQRMVMKSQFNRLRRNDGRLTIVMRKTI